MSMQFGLAFGLILVLGALFLFSDDGGKTRKLHERILATRELRDEQPAAFESMIQAQAPRGLLFRLAGLLGYDDDLPAGYGASPGVVGPMAAIAGVIVFNLSSRVLALRFAVVLGIAVAIFIARFLFQRKSKAYIAILFKQIPDSMSLILRAVRAGLPIAEAIRSVGNESMSPTREEFARVAGETALGMPTEVALRRLAERTKIQEYGFFAVIVGLQAQTGGNLSETLENLADMVRRRVAMAAKSKALSAEGRLSAAVVAALPFVVAILIMLFTPSYLREFVTNPKGPMLIGVFLGLLSAGLFVSHLLIQRSTRD